MIIYHQTRMIMKPNKETRDYIRSYLQIENESTLIKDKVYNRRDWKYGLGQSKNDGLYDMSQYEKQDNKNRNKSKDIVDPHQFDEDEDQKIAFELLHRYKQDKGKILYMLFNIHIFRLYQT